MRPHRRLLVSALAVGLGAGCGAATGDVPTSEPRPSPGDEAELEALREQTAEQSRRVRELEGRLALAQAEARDVRDELAMREATAPRETVRIGDEAEAVDPNLPPWEDTEEPPEDDGPRPVLRLYGSPTEREQASSGPLPPLVLPPAPAGMPDRLPVAPLPGEDEAQAPAMREHVELPHQPEPERDHAEALYRTALARVRDRRFEQADRALEALLADHAGHPRALDARYWRGVVRYAQRRYEEALADFRWVAERHAQSERAPDALLKMALCHQRMGDARRARALMQRVRSLYPDSVAARLASEETS